MFPPGQTSYRQAEVLFNTDQLLDLRSCKHHRVSGEFNHRKEQNFSVLQRRPVRCLQPVTHQVIIYSLKTGTVKYKESKSTLDWPTLKKSSSFRNQCLSHSSRKWVCVWNHVHVNVCVCVACKTLSGGYTTSTCDSPRTDSFEFNWPLDISIR